MPVISVIVPVYNVEQYIERCVTSILDQTFRDFELILVDDGSPDNCGLICDAFARQDPRIIVIHQENQGLSAARNAGIDWVFAHSSSQWLHFVDSDDWIHPQTLERLLNANLSLGTDISVCEFIRTDSDAIDCAPITREPVPIGWDELYKNYRIAVYAWGKLYRRSCFQQLRYPPGKIYEDAFLVHRLLYNRPIALLPEPCYRYRITPGSITRAEWTPQRMDHLEAIEAQLRFFETLQRKDLLESTLNRYFFWNFYSFIQINKSKRRFAYRCYSLRCIRQLLGIFPYAAKHRLRILPAVTECLRPIFRRIVEKFSGRP
jgi:glycosyltransferase involved in cell wall biosynthesis